MFSIRFVTDAGITITRIESVRDTNRARAQARVLGTLRPGTIIEDIRLVSTSR
jgi:hypothetical protein